jgi:hypothetical protein
VAAARLSALRALVTFLHTRLILLATFREIDPVLVVLALLGTLHALTAILVVVALHALVIWAAPISSAAHCDLTA